MKLFFKHKFKASLCLIAVGLAEKDGTIVQDDSASRFICGGEITGDGVIISPGLDEENLDYGCKWKLQLRHAIHKLG